MSVEDLKKALARRQVTVVVGAGVSVQATGNAKCASWKGLLEDGAARAADQSETFRANRRDIVQREIASGDLENMLSAAEKISRALGAPDGGDYSLWLRESVGALSIVRRDVLDAIHELRALVTTTNYDGLLESASRPTLPAVTWRDPGKVERILREDEQGILHLHGHWDEPESVVFGTGSYERIVGDEHAQSVLRALRLRSTLLLIGCGAGVEDPNFQQLRSWLKRVMKGSEYPAYRLARDGEYRALQEQHAQDERITVLPYGAAYDDLAPFLQSLKPPVLVAPEISIAGIDEVLAWGWSLRAMMDALIEMDMREMAPPEGMEGTSDQWVPIFEEHPETWRLLVTGPRQVVGYACFVPLSPEAYASVRAGGLIDSKLSLEMIQSIDIPGEFDVYFISICVEGKYQKLGFRPRLFGALASIASEAASYGAFIREVCTNASTPAGKALCEQLHMKAVAEHCQQGTIYTIPFRDMIREPLFVRNTELLRLYDARYGS